MSRKFFVIDYCTITVSYNKGIWGKGAPFLQFHVNLCIFWIHFSLVFEMNL
jgi:hypothetical protein